MENTAKVLNKRIDGEPEGSVYIGRGSPYENPFVIGPHGDRDQVCDLFEQMILPKLDLEPLRGKDLVCFCKPLRCHGDAIMAKLLRLGRSAIAADRGRQAMIGGGR